MSAIKDLLDQRNNLYMLASKKILALFDEKLNKAMQYFVKIDRDIHWISVEYIPGISDFVFISGFLEVQLGDEIAYSPEEKLKIDEEFLKVNSSQTLIRIMIGIDDLEKCTAKEIYEKIKDYYELSSKIPQENIIKILNSNKFKDMKSVLDEVSEYQKDEHRVTVAAKEDLNFDESVLSEEQKLQLKCNLEFSKARN